MKLHDFLCGTYFNIKHATYYVKVGKFGLCSGNGNQKCLMKIGAEKIIRQIKAVRKIKRKNIRFAVKVDFSQILIDF